MERRQINPYESPEESEGVELGGVLAREAAEGNRALLNSKRLKGLKGAFIRQVMSIVVLAQMA